MVIKKKKTYQALNRIVVAKLFKEKTDNSMRKYIYFLETFHVVTAI